MITGRRITLEGRFGSDMSSFLSSVNSADVTYKGSKIEVDDKKTDNSETRFNFSLSVRKYRSTLAKEYSAAIIELEETLSETYNKFDKLYFIARIIAEIESYRRLLEKSDDSKYRHKLFQFSNTSKEEKYQDVVIDEDYCQEYYQWMDYYLQKMHAFLHNLKEITEKTNQADFAIPQSMIPDANASTKEKPLEYFDYLFTRSGLYYLREHFKPSEEAYHYTDIKYDHKTETITEYYQDQETGEWEESTRTFKDFYLKRLSNEFQISRKLIDDHINDLREEAAITLFIKLAISKLKYLLTAIDRYPDAKRYEDSPKPINALIRFFHEKYAAFIPKEMLPAADRTKAIEGPVGKIEQQTLLPAPKTGVATFRWKHKSDIGLSTSLWDQLKEGGFIHESTDPEVFHHAFNGSVQEHPLKIRWTATAKNKQVNKHLLLYMMDQLASTGLIEEDTDNSTFIRKLGFVFYDPKGEPLQNLSVSNSTSGKKRKTKTPEEQKIDGIIAVLVRQAGTK